MKIRTEMELPYCIDCRVFDYTVKHREDGHKVIEMKAAPELLEAGINLAACRSLVMVAMPYNIVADNVLLSFKRMEAAIAKAEGR